MGLKKIDGDKLLSVTAMVISISTLLVFLYQTNLIRKQQYMSVYPYLSLGSYGTNTDEYKFVIGNDGIGPAILKKISVKAPDGTDYDDISPYVGASLLMTDTLGYLHSNISPGRLIPANEEVEIIESYDKKLKTSIRLYEILHQDSLEIVIEYESIYGERWRITNGNSIPEKL